MTMKNRKPPSKATWSGAITPANFPSRRGMNTAKKPPKRLEVTECESHQGKTAVRGPAAAQGPHLRPSKEATSTTPVGHRLAVLAHPLQWSRPARDCHDPRRRYCRRGD